MAFHLGRPILVMVSLAAVAGVAMSMRSAPPKRDLEFWLFSGLHADTFRGKGDAKPGDPPTLVEDFERKNPGRHVEIRMINMRAIETRMLSLLMSDAKGDTVPDVFSIDVSSIGKFFRFPADDVGLKPLDEFLDRPLPASEGGGTWRQRLPAARLATWTRGGKVFGIPYDIHPSILAYRADLFEQAGVDLPACKTWDAFHEACIRYRSYWRVNGHPERFALEASETNAGLVSQLLLQRHINLVDSELQCHLSDPKVLDTVVKYARMVAGPTAVGTSSSPGAYAWITDLEDGAIGSFVLADHRIGYLHRQARKSSDGHYLLEGKLRMMPLPVFEPGDSRTTTSGGTMAGIPRNAKDPEGAWKVIEEFYLSNEALEARFRNSEVITPDKTKWDAPRYHQPDPLFSNQIAGEMLTEMARELPAFQPTAFSSTAGTALGSVVQKQYEAVNRGALPEEQVEIARKNLAEADAYVKRMIAFSSFE